jgi:photosystem II stability/assembly factor-like uncharacterized protein
MTRRQRPAIDGLNRVGESLSLLPMGSLGQLAGVTPTQEIRGLLEGSLETITMKIPLASLGFLALAWGACTSHASIAASCNDIDPIRAFDLIAPGTGWAASSTHLYFTSSDGHSWRDITPPRASDNEPIQLVHFTDRFHGSVLLIDVIENQPTFLEVEETANGGSSWKLAQVDLSRTPIDPVVPPTVSSMSFSDHRHGWILIGTSSANIRTSVLVATVDAGAHWQVLRILPIDGNISFGSSTHGVLTSAMNPSGDPAIWHTKDGGRSWTASTPPAPKDCPTCIPVQVDGAFFSDTRHAVLTAVIRIPGKSVPSSVEYFTSDSGATWRLGRRPERSRMNADIGLTTVTDGHVIGISAAPHNSLVLRIDGRKRAVTLPPSLTPGGLDRLSFASDRRGWALFTAQRTDLVSVDAQHKRVKVITPRPSRIKLPAKLPQ